MTTTDPKTAPKRIGRYVLFDPIASGGMATVHYGLMTADAGFTRVVAIKRVRADKRNRRGSEESLLDEARLASRVQHPNVVPPLDVFWHRKELLVVLEYVAGESLSRLLRATDERDERIPLKVGITVVAQVLHGLHAAHDAKSARGKPLGIVHRDVSPQNILVGSDGLSRVLDFGIAKATERLTTSMAGQIKGKLAYMAPEQLQGRADRRTDIYASAVVLWEILAGRRLFHADNSRDLFARVLQREIKPPSHYADVPPELDELVMRGLEREPEDRFETARHFALALEDVAGVASSAQIGDWVEQVAGTSLSERAAMVAQLERDVTREQPDGSVVVESSVGAEAEAVSDAISTPKRGPSQSSVASAEPSTLPRPQSSDTATEVELESEDSIVTRESLPSGQTESMTMVAAGVQETTPQGEEATMPAVTIPGRPSGSESTETPPPTLSPAAPESRRGAGRWLAVLAFLSIGGVAAYFLAPRPEAPRPADAEPSPPPGPRDEAPPDGLPSATAPTSAKLAPTPAPSSPSTPPLTTASSAPPPAPTGTFTPPPRPPFSLPKAVPKSQPKTTPKSPPKPNCNPPYTIDDRGIRRLKPQCL